MSRSFRLPFDKIGVVGLSLANRDPKLLARIVVGSLLAANLVAALILLKPWGGSPEDLARELSSLQRQVQQRRAALKQSRSLLAKVETARTQGDQFLESYFAERRSAPPLLLGELDRIAKEAGMKPKEHSFSSELIEGSDTLEMMTIVGNYEGNYGDLIQFVNGLDRSPRFIIIEQMNASPQPSTGLLNVNLKMYAFVRGEEPLPAPSEPAGAAEQAVGQ
ncbi:MAG: hypothetical protein IRZ15_09075 [Bryobacteraceae bacterium]|jgi:hypothetical protein|nr:hypothetical protein [Bryobacteraceae bacterium]